MTIVVTRDVAPRFRGFLASCMLEIAPGVYTSPRMHTGIRDRVWSVMEDWFSGLGGGSIVMTWTDKALPGGQRILVLGDPPCELVRYDGVYLAQKRPVPTPEMTSDSGGMGCQTSDNLPSQTTVEIPRTKAPAEPE